MNKTYVKQSPETIKKLFNSIAARYDIANSINSFHMHTLWNKRLVQGLFQGEKPKKILDICAGTGEISWTALRFCQKKKIELPEFHLVDFSSEMLMQAKSFCQTLQEPLQKHFFFYEQDAEALHFDENSFDTISCAYGIRNVQNTKKCFQELYRVLKPNGRLGILELTRPKNWLLKLLHKAYTHTVLPLVGRCVCANSQAYSYLSTSIQHFESPDEMHVLLRDCGFENVYIQPLHFGITTLIMAQK